MSTLDSRHSWQHRLTMWLKRPKMTPMTHSRIIWASLASSLSRKSCHLCSTFGSNGPEIQAATWLMTYAQVSRASTMLKLTLSTLTTSRWRVWTKRWNSSNRRRVPRSLKTKVQSKRYSAARRLNRKTVANWMTGTWQWASPQLTRKVATQASNLKEGQAGL